MPDVTCHLYDIVEPNASSLGNETWNMVLTELERSQWFGKFGQRYGAVNTVYRGQLLVGFFAHEGQKLGVQYDENKKPVTQSSITFEHLFFAIFSDTSQLLLQHRNIYGYDDLGFPIMRTHFLEMLGTLLQQANVFVKRGKVRIESAGTTYTQEEMYEFFANNATVRMTVLDLQEARIPARDAPEYILYNPREEWNEITWAAVADTYKAGARNITISGSDDATRLNDGPLPKAFARTGVIDEVQAMKDDHIVVKKKTEEAEISIFIPSASESVLPALETVLQHFDADSRRDAWNRRAEQRRADELRGTLYDENGS